MKKLTFFLFFILIGLMTACSTPPPPVDQAQAAENETAPAVEAPAAQPADPLPPVVLRTSPEPGEEQPIDAPIEIVFDQPMDRNSVEKAFAIEPGASVDGAFEWVDDQTVRFAFKDGFKRGERYRVRVIESAQSQAGLALQRPFELRFSTAGFLEVTNVQPADGATEILPDSVVTVVFNRPVVPLGAIENAAGLPDPLTFVPPVTGQGEWLNTSIYQFTPDVGFEPATEYQARVAQGLADAAGNAVLADDFEWTFTTVTPQAVGSIPANGDIYVSPTPVISVTFNQPMDRRSVEQNFSLRNENTNEVISGKFAWVEQGISQSSKDQSGDYYYYDYAYDQGAGPTEVGVETVMFTPDKTLDFNGIYAVVLPKETRGKIGQAETTAEFKATFTIIPYPAIDRTYPVDGDEQMEPWQSLQVTFNGPMNPDTLVFGQNLVIEPTVAVTQVYTYWWSSNTSLELSFPTQASSQYTVTLGANIEGRYGQRLGKSTRVSWQTRAESPLVYMHSAGRIATYNAYTDTLAFITVRNVGRVQFGLYRLPKADFIRLNASDWWEAWDRYNPAGDNLISEWELKTTPELDDNVIYRIDLGQRSGLGERLPPGLYYLEASVDPDDIYPQATGPNSYLPSPERKMLVVSKNNITFKTTGSEGLAWLTDLQSGQPVGNMPIDFVTTPYGSSPLDLGQASTAADGVAQTDYSESGDPFEARFAFAGDPDQGDDDFGVTVSNWTDGIDRWQFDNVNVEDYQQPYNAQFYTDRKIYRPGQTVYFKGVIRSDDDARYSLPTAFDTVNVTITDSQGKEVFSDDLPVSEFGTVYGSFDLDANAGLGFYSIQILFEENQYFYTDFQVAAYRKPEYLVEVTTDKPEYVQGDQINVSASAEFFSGGPVSNAKVRWTLLSDDYFFQYTPPVPPLVGGGIRGGYDFTDYDFSRQSQGNYFPGFGEKMAEGEGVTDANGRFTFEVEADIAAKIASQRFTFDVVITDINNQEVASQAQAVVHKGLVYVGLRPEEYVGQVGQSSLVNVLVVDWDSEPVARQEVQLVFSEHNWYSVQKQYEDGSFYWDSVVEDIPVFTTTVTSAADGQAVADFTPEQGGVYKVAATAIDRQGNEVRSSTFMWVSGSEYVNWRQENNDRIDLVADQREYRVGDTATILVPHPYSGTVQALVTLERGHIYNHYVTELQTNSEQLQIPIEEWMIPNMYVSVVVVQGSTPPVNGGGMGWVLPSFKVGYASLPINTAEKQLNITLTPSPPRNPPPQEGGGWGGYQPGDTVEYQVKVTDVSGQPVKAELSLALVDKAVLSLAPEEPGQLLNTFWRNRGLGVQTAGGLTLAIDRINLTVAPEAKGGGGGFDEGFGVIRGEFKDTALWLPDLATDNNGEATAEVKLPDNLTTWTMTGKGVTGADTLVGENTVEIVSTKPLLVRPVAPRFFVVGDEAQVGMIVQNNTDQPQEVEVRFEAEGVELGEWRIANSEWSDQGEPTFSVGAGERVKVDYKVTVDDVERVNLTMGAKSEGYGDALTFDLPVYRFSTPETVATAGVMVEDGTRIESIVLPRSYDPTQGGLTVNVDPSLAAGMRNGLDYLEHFPYECTEQTVSRFLPNVVTYRAYQQLGMDVNPTPNAAELADKLPGLVSVGLQRLYNQQHFDGGWGWWTADESDPYLTAYVLLGLVEARRAGFAVDEVVIDNAANFLQASLVAPKDVDAAWQANRQAFVLYVLAEAGYGDLSRSNALFKERPKLDIFGRAYLAMAIYLLDEQASQVDTLLDDITSAAIVSATGAHWEEAQVDYYAMNTDTRSTAIVIAALSRLQPDHPLLPNAVRWLMNIREHGGHWETTQETAWAIIGLTDFMVATGELEGNYQWRVSLNGAEMGQGTVDQSNIDETTQLRADISELLADEANRLVFERDPVGRDISGSPGRLYYGAYLTYYKPVPEVKALDRGIVVSRQYSLATPTLPSPSEGEGQGGGKAISQAKVGDVIQVKLTIIAPNDLHYVVVEDPLPAGAEGIDTSLATTSVVEQQPELTRTDRRNPWSGDYGRWYFSHTELRDEKAVLFATYLPKGTYEYTYTMRASLPGEYRVIPTHAEQMYFPEVFGRGDGGLFRITE